MRIDTKMKPANSEPTTASIRSWGYSSGPMPRSATAAAWYSCMYGVIVVPTSATAISRNAWLPTKCGMNVSLATSAQSGFARIIASG